jgi:UDP-N-acetylmuramoyl-tripeptide--D-alanyl-D-alanine ligase
MLAKVAGRRVGVTVAEPGPGQLGVVDGMLVDRAFADSAELGPAATVRPSGAHNVSNALAAAACAHAAGVPVATIAKGLEAVKPYTGRMQTRRALSGATLIDDSYNANPDSVRAAIDVLAACAAPTVLVLGDMGEVGAQGPLFHREIGAYARERGIGALYALGDASREAVSAFGQGARHFASPEHLQAALPAAGTVLVKGSRFMRMERVVAALTGEAEGGH